LTSYRKKKGKKSKTKGRRGKLKNLDGKKSNLTCAQISIIP